MRLNRLLGVSGMVWLAVLTACQEDSPPTSPSDRQPGISAKKSSSQSHTYLVSFGDDAPSDLAARLERAGGKVKHDWRTEGNCAVEADNVTAPNSYML